MNIEILNETETEVDVQRLVDLGKFLFGKLYLHPETELSVMCVDTDTMAQLHLDWMDLPGPTDVMSFPMDELRPGTPEELSQGMLGDVVLCPEVAAAQALNAGHSTADELALLLAHGVLHLVGFDHTTAEEQHDMFSLQDRLLTEFLGYPAPAPTTE